MRKKRIVLGLDCTVYNVLRIVVLIVESYSKGIGHPSIKTDVDNECYQIKIGSPIGSSSSSGSPLESFLLVFPMNSGSL